MIIDHGHIYKLLALDGDDEQTLRFVKREGEKFPGNKGSHSGTNAQSVLRVLHSRICFLNSQHHCDENTEVAALLRRANWLLENRAAKRHGLAFNLDESQAIDAPMCATCGHTVCKHVAR